MWLQSDQRARPCRVPRRLRSLKRAIGVVHQRSKWQPSVSTAGRVGGQENRLDGIRFRLIACPRPVTTRKEVRPMNAATRWVLPLVFTVRRLT